MIDPQFWQDELVVFQPAPHSDRDGSEEPGLDTFEDELDDEIIASLADPDYARNWLQANDEMHELLFQQARSAEQRLASIHVLAVLWMHSDSLHKQAHGEELLKIITRK